jgi:hypothetical protein
MAQSERYHPAAPGTRLGELPGPLDGRVAIVTGAAGGLGAALDAFTAAGLAARAGCGCREHTEHASGAGTAAALAVHRFLEGSAVALGRLGGGRGSTGGARVRGRPGHRGAARRPATPRGGLADRNERQPPLRRRHESRITSPPIWAQNLMLPRCGHWRSSSASAPTTTAGTAGPDQRAEATQNYPATGWRRGHPGRSRPAGPAPTRSSPLTWPPPDHDGTPGNATKTGTPAP